VFGIENIQNRKFEIKNFEIKNILLTGRSEMQCVYIYLDLVTLVFDLSKTIPVFNEADFNIQDTRRGQNADNPASHLLMYLNDDDLPSSQS
jgi:hypothetical protein